MSEEDYYEKKLKLGDEAEALVKDFFINVRGYMAIKVPHAFYPYDLIVKTKSGKRFTVEVKLYGNPDLDTIFAETVQISPKAKIESCPEYLTYHKEIKYMMYVDMVNKIGYLYHMRKFASYVLANKGSEFPIERGTAKGIKINKTSLEAGFICEIPLCSGAL